MSHWRSPETEQQEYTLLWQLTECEFERQKRHIRVLAVWLIVLTGAVLWLVLAKTPRPASRPLITIRGEVESITSFDGFTYLGFADGSGHRFRNPFLDIAVGKDKDNVFVYEGSPPKLVAVFPSIEQAQAFARGSGRPLDLSDEIFNFRR